MEKSRYRGTSRLFVDPCKKTPSELEKESTINDLYRQVGLLSIQLEWFKKNVVSTRSLNERRALIDWENRQLSISTQAELLEINRTGLYYVTKPLSAEELELHKHIDINHTINPCYGSRRICAVLRNAGFVVSRKRIQRIMRDMGLLAIYPTPKGLSRGDENPKYPYLLRNVSAEYPNHIWGNGHHLCQAERRFYVPDGDIGLVFALCVVMVIVGLVIDGICEGSVG